MESEAAVLVDPEVDSLVDAVLTASRVLVGVSASSLADLEDTVTLPQFRTLVVLEAHGAINLNRLAELLKVNASTAMRMVDRLMVGDLVHRSDHPESRREVLIELSEHGRHLVRSVTERRHREIRKIVRKMSASRRQDLVAALRAFAVAAGEPSAREGGTGTIGW